MGLNERETQTTFLSLTKKGWAVRVAKDDPNAVMRINANNKEVFERFFESVEGYLVDIKVVQKDLGKGLVTLIEFKLFDGSQNYTISLGYHDGRAKSILHRLPNIILSKPIKIKALYFKNEDSIALGIYQDGNTNTHPEHKTVNRFWNRESPDLPQFEVIDMGPHEKAKVNDTKQMVFLIDYVQKSVLPKIRFNQQLSPEDPAIKMKVAGLKREDLDIEESGEFANDDLPF